MQLISVSGVGPKVGIAALSGGPARELLRAIAAGDAKRFQAVPGIGKRTAERILVELREKVAGEIESRCAESAEIAVGPRSRPARDFSTSATRRSRPRSCSDKASSDSPRN